jgi:hypothetical protein
LAKFASELHPSQPKGGTDLFFPRICSRLITLDIIRVVGFEASPQPLGGVSPTPHPLGDGPPDLVRRIFLNEMDPRHGLLSIETLKTRPACSI